MSLYFRYPHPKTNQFCYRHVLWANQEPRKFAETWECRHLHLSQNVLPRRMYHLIPLIREISDSGLNKECIMADCNIIHNFDPQITCLHFGLHEGVPTSFAH